MSMDHYQAKKEGGSGWLARQLFLLVLLLAMLEVGMSLQVHEGAATAPSNAYYPNLYLKQLSMIQTRFAKDITSIQATFTKINSNLNSTNITSSSQIISLEQTLAQQSNALYNIQTYLNVPFALKSCECLNFTVPQRIQLQKKISNVSASIKLLQTRLYQNTSGNPVVNAKCPSGSCPVVNQIRKQIAQLKNYDSIMTATINSNCCNRTLYFFIDNLANYPFWIFGNLTTAQYKAEILKKANGSKMATCPSTLPFANFTNNQCFICPAHSPLFDLALRKCVPPCHTKGLILDVKTHQCVYNTTCNPGMYFNYNTHKCQVSLGSSSRCPLSVPVWNAATLSCQPCPNSKPFFDVIVRACRACTVNEVFDPFNRICYSKAIVHPVGCPPATAYNVATNKCQSLNGTVVNATVFPQNVAPIAPAAGTSSSCPPSAPYYNQLTFVCQKCPSSKPYYNSATITCSICPITTPLYNATRKVCEICPAKTVFNSTTNTCTSSAVKCAIGTILNSTTNSCQPIVCPSTKPILNKLSGVCEACPSGTIYSSVTGVCASMVIPTGVTSVCPPATPYYNPINLGCQACPFGQKLSATGTCIL